MHPDQQYDADDKFGPLPQQHPREVPVQLAETDLSQILFEWRKRHSLTSAEYLHLLGNAIAINAAVLMAHERR